MILLGSVHILLTTSTVLQLQPTSPVADLCTDVGRQQANSIIVSMSSQLTVPVACSKSCRQTVQLSTPCYPPWTGSCQLKLQQACEGAAEGVTLEELHSALKASARGKKPGSDGLPYEFFAQFWDLLGPELLAVLQDSFQTQHAPSLPASMTQGVITLLYKGKGPHALLDSYRPITLLNSDYKLLAKALAMLWACFTACG